MKEQNYSNYVRYFPLFHFFLMPLSFVTLVAAVVYLVLNDHSGLSLLASLLFVSLSFMLPLTLLVTRMFAAKVQDRAIRAEESLRHFVLSGKRLDPRLTIGQIIALRFASDEEFLSLCEKAANENMTPDAIKRSVKTWRADHHRV